jgi:hypothetical protein
VIHHATTLLDDETYDWVSLDGDSWLPVTRPPIHDREGEEEMIRGLFDGDGNFKPLVFTRSWLAHEGAVFDRD